MHLWAFYKAQRQRREYPDLMMLQWLAMGAEQFPMFQPLLCLLVLFLHPLKP
jgi:hypothetical protein